MPGSLLVFGSCWPEPASSAAGTRTLQVLDLFLADHWDVTFLTAAKRRTTSAELPEGVVSHAVQLNDSAVDDLIRKADPDLVWFDRFMVEEQFGWRVSAVCPEAKRLIDTIDLHSLREIRRVALQEKREPEMKDWFRDTALRELAAMLRSDLSLLISEEEHRILTQELKLPAALFHVLPFLCSPKDQTAWEQSPPFAERKNLVTIGNFRHPPNADSVRFLAKELWPGIRKACPEAEMHVYGADQPPALQTLHDPEKGFHLCGRAEDAVETLSRYRVCLAPLRFGAGLKGKLLDAMLAGMPSVTTSIGAEGMQGDHPWPGRVCEAPAALIDAAVLLYTDEDRWNACRPPIQPLLQERFDRDTHTRIFLDRLKRLRTDDAVFCPDRLPGALLRHHQHRSTEYMSRWIELKNKQHD